MMDVIIHPCPKLSNGGPRCSLIARFMGPTWGPSGVVRTQVGPMLAPWTFLSGFSLKQALGTVYVFTSTTGHWYGSLTRQTGRATEAASELGADGYLGPKCLQAQDASSTRMVSRRPAAVAESNTNTIPGLHAKQEKYIYDGNTVNTLFIMYAYMDLHEWLPFVQTDQLHPWI